MKDLTVLSPQVDPYRIDTDASHRDGEWFAEQFEHARQRPEGRHLRGAHYAIAIRGDVRKPDGSVYINDDANWAWLANSAAKAARWLGYVPFDSIIDNRNKAPIIHRRGKPSPWAYIDVSVEVTVPDADDIRPTINAYDFRGRQPYYLIIFGEKSSLKDTVEPIAVRYDADLYLMTGEISDTYVYRIAKDGAEDGRPMRVFTLADCDPAGRQMPVSIGRKLQALRDLEFHDLDFEVHPICVTFDQVRELDLPSTPLKETERRADRWRDAFGVEQTEIDALDELRPGELAKIVRAAIKPFWDSSLDSRVSQAFDDWADYAQAKLDAHIDTEFLHQLRSEAALKLAEIETEIAKLNESMRQAVPDDVPLPPIEIPEPEVNESVQGVPLISSRWSWTEQTRALIERKAYGNGRFP